MSTDWMDGYRRGQLPGPEVCRVCGVETMRPKIIMDGTGRAVFCRLHIPSVHLIGAGVEAKQSRFSSFTLDHVRDEHGQKVTVNSLSELRAAEKRYNFALAVAADDGGAATTPPQHEPWAGDITYHHKKRFNRDPEAYRSEAARQGVTAGIAKSAKDTLADHPNPV